MTMRVYQSTDASAPTLQGVVGGAYSGGWADGSLLNLLEKCLVTGYGSKTAAGWSTAFTGTSKGVFRQGGGCQFYMRVLDDGSLTAGAREAQFYGGETASDVDTLVSQFPTSTQQSTYMKFRKSDAATSATRSWIVLADNKTVIVMSWFNQNLGGTDYLTSMYFGDFHSLVPGDTFNCCAWARVTSATLDNIGNEKVWTSAINSTIFTGGTGVYAARPYSGLGSAVHLGCMAHIFCNVTSGNPQGFGGSVYLPFPNPADSKIILSRPYFYDPTTAPTPSVRGWARGMWASQHPIGQFPKGLDFQGVGTVAGKTFRSMGIGVGAAAGNLGLGIVETSDTWD